MSNGAEGCLQELGKSRYEGATEYAKEVCAPRQTSVFITTGRAGSTSARVDICARVLCAYMGKMWSMLTSDLVLSTQALGPAIAALCQLIGPVGSVPGCGCGGGRGDKNRPSTDIGLLTAVFAPNCLSFPLSALQWKKKRKKKKRARVDIQVGQRSTDIPPCNPYQSSFPPPTIGPSLNPVPNRATITSHYHPSHPHPHVCS